MADFQKSGRGGAGNYYFKRDVDDVEKRAGQDIEAQKDTVSLRLSRINTAHAEYARTGRGGAGNVVFTSEPDAKGSALGRDSTSRTLSGAVGGQQSRPQGHGGRGGAGNWGGNQEERMTLEKEERVRREVELSVQEEVMGALKLPERAYRGPGDETSGR